MRLPLRLLRRKVSSHKGDFGHVFVLAGSLRFSGAGLLSCEAALRAGAGLVTLAVPKSLALSIIRVKAKEVMVLPLKETVEKTHDAAAYKDASDFLKQADVLVVGPGLTQNKSTRKLIRRLVVKCNKPTVLDADGLNAFAGSINLLRNKAIVITPHPKEMARLLGISVAEVQRKRKEVAKKAAKDYNVTVVLKGHNTVIADKANVYINKTGNPGMSTAGAGDVLAGMIAALLGQGLSLFDAAKYGVYLHGLAGDLAAKEKTQISLIASDIIAKIPEAIKKSSSCRRSSVGRAIVL